MSQSLLRPAVPTSCCTGSHRTAATPTTVQHQRQTSARQRVQAAAAAVPSVAPALTQQHCIPTCSRSPCSGRSSSRCQATKFTSAAVDEAKEAHKIFDEAVVTVRSGAGGSGEIVEAGRGKWVDNLKYHPGANQPKKLWLPASQPADGADGADVVLVCDPSLDSLLHLHKRKEWAGKRGAQGNPAAGSAGAKRSKEKKAVTPPLEVPVPPGTVVKRKGTGQVLGEVLQPGDRLVVASGGKGGRGVVAPSRMQKQQELAREFKRAKKAGAEVVAVEDINWKDDAKGLPGQQLTLQLLLRVVADVGLVGFPNAGKSSLLAALTRARPEVAPYPFTTLMPNLGVLAAGGSGPVLADLPGLIEGAHLGKGLGRMFLRHLRRTQLLLQVVDASAADPATDYLAVREELRMYNPQYVTRPHVVALNKVDLEDAGGLRQEIADEVMAAAQQLQQQHAQELPGLTAPAAIVACSAVTGEGLQELAAAVQSVLQELALGSSSSNGSIIAQHVGKALEEQQREHAEQRRQRLQQLALEQQQQGQGQAQPLQPQQERQQGAAAADLAAAFSAALGVPTAAAAAAAAPSSPQDNKGQAAAPDSQGGSEGSGSAAAEDTEAASAEGEYAWEGEEEEWEEGQEEEGEFDEGEWEALDLERLLGAGSSDDLGEFEEGEGQAEQEEEEEGEDEDLPAPLAADDPDAWLLKLSEEELLKLADAAEETV